MLRSEGDEEEEEAPDRTQLQPPLRPPVSVLSSSSRFLLCVYRSVWLSAYGAGHGTAFK